MQSASGRIAFDPQDIDAIIDQIAEKRRPLPAGFSPRGIRRGLVSGEMRIIGMMDDGAVVELPVAE